MRIVILCISAAGLIGTGVAFAIQATRLPSPPLEAVQEAPVAAAAVADAPQAAEVTEVAATPMTYRRVRSVSIAEPKPMTEPSSQAAAEDGALPSGVSAGREGQAATASASRPDAPAPAVGNQTKAAAESSRQEAAAVEQPVTKPAQVQKRYTRRKTTRGQAAGKQDAPSLPPAALAYDGSNEEHTPLRSLRKIFSGAQ